MGTIAILLAILKITGNIQLSWWWIVGLISVHVIVYLLSSWAENKKYDVGKDWHPGMFE